MMKPQLKQLFPQWVSEKLDRELIMSNDLDSILACTLLNKQFGYKINGYYSFDLGLGFINPNIGKKHIGVDIALNNKMYCWDNHVTILNSDTAINKNSANLNTIYKVSAKNKYEYFKKFAGSTAMQIWSYYGFEVPEKDNGKMMLLSIDSAYLGYYRESFRDTWINYMELLGFEELIEFCSRHTEEDFKEFKKLYTENFNFSDGIVYYSIESRKFVEECLDMELYIPTEQFLLHTEMKAHQTTMNNVQNLSKDTNVFSYAVTGINKIKYTTIN